MARRANYTPPTDHLIISRWGKPTKNRLVVHVSKELVDSVRQRGESEGWQKLADVVRELLILYAAGRIDLPGDATGDP